MITRLTNVVEDTCEAAFEDANETLDEALLYLDGTRATFPPRFDQERIQGCDESEINDLKDRAVDIFGQFNY